MTRVVSIIPSHKDSETGVHVVQGTKVLLDDGSYLQGINSITLKAEAGKPWVAVIEVYPINQKQIDALVEELKVIKHE